MNAPCVVKMNNLAVIKNKLIYLYVILIAYIPSAYVISQLNLNADRLFFIIISGFWLLFAIMSSSIKLSKIQFFLIIYFIIVLLNNLLIGQLQLMSIYIAALLILISSNDLRAESFIKAINIAFYALVFWALYSIGHFYTIGYLTEVPFSQFLEGFIDTKLEHAEQLSHSYIIFPRVSFPFATPPQLSAVGALYFFFYRFLDELHGYGKRYSYGISKFNINFGLIFSIIIMLSTVSRTGIAMLGAGLLVSFLFKMGKLVHINSLFKFIFSGIVAVFFIWVLYLSSSQSIELDFILSRVISLGGIGDQDGHFTIRALGFQHFSELSWFDKIFGIGYLNFEGLHYHSSFLTSLIETGLIGSLSLIFIVLYPAIKAFNLLIKSNGISTILARYSILVSALLFTAHVVYEMPYIHSLWFFWALAILTSKELQQE